MKKIVIPTLSIILLFGCSYEDEQDELGELSSEPLEVEIFLEPDVQVDESVEVETEVTQGGKPVDDAHEVEFEIRVADTEEGIFIEAEPQGDGIYSISYSFAEDGIYEVQSHVTARGMHIMPVETVKVHP
nr:Putative lipoprotein [Bacillaceae bacterium JMAK1]